MISLSKHFAVRRSAIWLAVGVCVCVLGWRLCVIAAQYTGGHAITGEVASVLQFEQDLSPNSANTRLVFCQDTEEGVGIYFCDIAGGKPKLLCEQKEKGHSWKRFTMLGWSPDDSLFACAFPDPKLDKEMVLVFNGGTGEPAGKVAVDQSLYQFAWLSSDTFAYCTRTDVRVVVRQGDGSWEHKRFFEKVATNMDNFTAVSANSIAWEDNRAIWLFDIATASAKRIWDARQDNLMEFTYSKPAGEFLLNCRDGAGQYLLRFLPDQTNTIKAGRIGPWFDYVHKALWDGQGTVFAYLTNAEGVSVFCLKSGEDPSPEVVPWHGGALSLTLNGGKAYFQGNPDGQTPGIWEYDRKSQAFRLIVASSDDPLKKVTGVSPTCGTLTNSLGEQRFYHLWAPAHVVAGRKYPLLLAQELNLWVPCFQIAADNGYYVAVVDRPFSHTWNGMHERTWTEDVMGLYNVVARQPGIDSNRVYLYAISAETMHLSPLLSDKPELWKGAIMLTPLAFPNPAVVTGKRILMVDGAIDGNAMVRLPKFQDEAAREACDVTLLFQDYADHVAASGFTERTRAMQFAKFLSEDN
jgi:hypothetical protein